jgi:predicted nucleic acid-binding protein
MALEAAINGRADAIVTHNKRDFVPATERFGIEVLSPAELLERIRRKERET